MIGRCLPPASYGKNGNRSCCSPSRPGSLRWGVDIIEGLEKRFIFLHKQEYKYKTSFRKTKKKKKHPISAKDTPGDADSTAYHNESAAKFVRYYRKHILKMPEEVLVTEINNGQLQWYIKQLLVWACTTPIPAYYVINEQGVLEPSNENNARCIKWVTIDGYIGKYLL